MRLSSTLIVAGLVLADPNTKPPLPQLAKFASFEELSTDGSYQYFWTVEDLGTPSEAINGALFWNATQYYGTSSQSAWGAWIGIGWGASMLNAEAFLAWADNSTRSIKTLDGLTVRAYAPFAPNPNGIIVTSNLFRGIVDNCFVVEFRRATRPASNLIQIDVKSFQPHIWAFNPNPSPRAKNKWLDSHGEQNRGAYMISYQLGAGNVGRVADLTAKRIHGSMMAIVWLLIFPASTFIARYVRFVGGWMRAHMYMQTFGSICGMLPSAVYIMISLPSNAGTNINVSSILRPHPLLGIFLCIFTFVQGLLGTLNRYAMSAEHLNVDRSRWNIIQMVHHYLGRILLLLAVVQIGLGLSIFFPLEETQFRGLPAWIIYFTFLTFWVIAFTAAEAYRYFKLRNIDQKDDIDYVALDNPPDFLLAGTLIPTKEKRAMLNQYTWEDIDSAVLNGDLLVVANGKYVYRMNEWISSHPGGQVILYSVAGTDITNDYFHEAGFDASSFLPSKIKRVASGKRLPAIPTNQNQNAQQPRVSVLSVNTAISVRDNEPSSPTSPKEWFGNRVDVSTQQFEYVVRARRTHVHSKAALAKLSTLRVGEIVSSEKSFDPFEYRRYALVESTLIAASSGVTAELGTPTPAYRLKFCLLYPFHVRNGTPDNFLPGQCVELQCRINGRFVSRYYTPISGNPRAFEIVVKLAPKGELTPFLTRENPGFRQFKIRGPFGASLLDTLPFGTTTSFMAQPKRILFIGGGSGITPALQLLEYVFLPKFESLMALYPYNPSYADELAIQPGDHIRIHDHFYDGWAEGVNLSSGAQGLFPLPVLQPLIGAFGKVVIANCIKSRADFIPNDQMKGALLAFQDYVSVTHFISPRLGTPQHRNSLRTSSYISTTHNEATEINSIPGQVLATPISAKTLVELLNDVTGSGQFTSFKAVICGPPSLQTYVYDTLTEECRVPHSFIHILPSDRFIA